MNNGNQVNQDSLNYHESELSLLSNLQSLSDDDLTLTQVCSIIRHANKHGLGLELFGKVRANGHILSKW